jgi:membrane-associated phospholipid phosphatase
MKFRATLLGLSLLFTPATHAEETRPVIQASLRGIADYGLAPLRWDKDDLAWILPTALGTGLLWNNDIHLYRQLSTGDARQEWLDKSMPVVSQAGEGGPELILVLLGYGLGNERLTKTSGTALQALAVSGAYTVILKYAAWSNRPSQDATQHRLWAYDQGTQGMPSGHTFSAFALAEVYGAEYGRIVPYTLASIMGYSRIYNQAHWSSDVFVGMVLGITAGHLSNVAAKEHGAPALKLSLQDRDGSPLLAAQWAY